MEPRVLHQALSNMASFSLTGCVQEPLSAPYRGRLPLGIKNLTLFALIAGMQGRQT